MALVSMGIEAPTADKTLSYLHVPKMPLLWPAVISEKSIGVVKVYLYSVVPVSFSLSIHEFTTGFDNDTIHDI